MWCLVLIHDNNYIPHLPSRAFGTFALQYQTLAIDLRLSWAIVHAQLLYLKSLRLLRYPDPYGPPGSASGSVSHTYWSGCGSFHQAKKVRQTFIFIVLLLPHDIDFLFFEDWCKCTCVPDPDQHVFGHLGSASGSVSQRYGSEYPDP